MNRISYFVSGLTGAFLAQIPISFLQNKIGLGIFSCCMTLLGGFVIGYIHYKQKKRYEESYKKIVENGGVVWRKL